MLKKDQKRIARELLANLSAAFLASVERVPEHWDGIELRALLIDHAKRFEPPRVSYPNGRKRDTLNDIASLNL